MRAMPWPKMVRDADTEADEVELRSITADAVQEKINLLPDKAPGEFNMHNRVTRALPRTAVEALADLFDRGWKGGVFPACWKVGVMAPVPKVARPSSVAEHRPIALLATLGKLHEGVTHVKLMERVARDADGVLPHEQHGGLKGKGCAPHLLSILEKGRRVSKAGGAMIAVFADVSKAFDSLDHETCTYFLHKAGHTPQALRWMRSWQEGRSYRVRCGVRRRIGRG